ncbi:MAG TPA: efflux transporter outer membrane subunit [Aliidongia sp.]|nr:efflux transporter outer membrane subunit [Aliidongia sp.]
MTSSAMKRPRMTRSTKLLAVLLTPAYLAGCEVGPDYEKPDAPVSASFKEAADGWKAAAPQDEKDRGEWWGIYHDPVLDGLERQIEISNQNLKVAEAQYRQSRAIVAETQATLFPTVALDGSGRRSGRGPGQGSGQAAFVSGGTVITSSGGGGGSANTQINGTADLSWDLDVWGKIRRTIEGDVATAQASAADLANAKLSAQASLASTYFQLRVQDELKRLLDDTVTAFARSLEITQNQYTAGTAAKSDVITAQTQLQSAQSQDIAVGIQRAQFEHAIAVLIGKAPADLNVASEQLTVQIPVTPTGVATTLLERRPDIAAAERQMEAANAQIGVAIAAYYPDLTLDASYGFTGSALNTLFRAANSVWSFGPSVSETIFDAGARSAAVDAARATYDQNVATYRQTVLTGFQQVEDELASLRILEQQATVEDSTVRSAQEAVRLAINEYKAGTVAYTTVVTAQSTALTEEESALTIRSNRLVASVTLIEALGGGWSVKDLPDREAIE